MKLNIKNAQIAEAIKLTGLKGKLAKKKASEKEDEGKIDSAKETHPTESHGEHKEDAPRIKARSRSAFAETTTESPEDESQRELVPEQEETFEPGEEMVELSSVETEKPQAEIRSENIPEPEQILPTEVKKIVESVVAPPTPKITAEEKKGKPTEAPQPEHQLPSRFPPRDRLGPTGRHVKDLYRAPVRPPMKEKAPEPKEPVRAGRAGPSKEGEERKFPEKERITEKEAPVVGAKEEESPDSKKAKIGKAKEFRDIKPARRQEGVRSFDSRDRQGLRDVESDEEHGFRRKKRKQVRMQYEDVTIRPTELKIRIPITIKELASEMKLKASELISKLFLQGLTATLNDFLEDETTIQLLGNEFGCVISIDSSEERRIRITDKTIKEEISESDPSSLTIRPPVVTFMGHVDHGKTSLIDAIRKSNRAAGEAGAITQHIGAFRCHTSVGDIAILDTPGHEAFSAMRARGADVTDIVVLVVAGDEGLRQQTLEAIQHAKAAKVTIVVAINKCDKPNFSADTVYRQLAEIDLLPESWGGQTITVNCSAVTGQGIKELLEMLALQAEILELKANPEARARGTVLESEMHKGLGAVATVLVQNGTLRRGDAIVFGNLWGRVKTMYNEFRQELEVASPSTPVEIAGLSGLPEAGQEFIVVKSEKEAKEIAEARMVDFRRTNLTASKRQTVESLLLQSSDTLKKVLNIVLRADVQGSLEALKAGLLKIESDKVILNIIFAGVGEVSESDVQLAAASKALILGFHTLIESHADMLVKQLGVQVRMHDIIYHAIDDVKAIMTGLLDKIAQENEQGKALVQATFKSSHVGVIAGCIVTEGIITRNSQVRVMREGNLVWKGPISSLKRVKEDVREVQKGLECGILLSNFNDIKENDILEAYNVTYISQKL